MQGNSRFSRWSFKLPSLFFAVILTACGVSILNSEAADFYRKTVEVYNTGVAGLKSWSSTCSGTSVNKADGTRGIVTSQASEFCSSYNRWRIRWTGDTSDRWSAEDWLRVIPPNLTVNSSVSRSPGSVVAGNSIRVTCDIANLGAGNARSSMTKVMILRASTFNIIATEEIETIEIPSNYYISFSYDIVVPANTPAGSYLVRIEVDSQGDIGQTAYGDDLKDSANFSVVPVYTVTANAGTGGSISPSGTQSVTSGNDISFTATPNASYTVADWKVGGTIAQTGGVTFQLNNVTSAKTVLVSFVRTYQLNVTVNGQGNYSLTPAGGNYPAGAQITATATPLSGNNFSEWNGAQHSRDRVFSFTKGGTDESLNVRFIPNLSPTTLSLTTAQSTPATIGVTIPTPNFWITICEVCTNLSDPVWRIVGVSEGQNPTVIITQPTPSANSGIYARYTSMPKVTTPPFLTFPIRLGGATAFTAPVTALFDHHRANPQIRMDYDKDHAIGTCLGKSYDVLKSNRDPGEDFAILPDGESAPEFLNYVGVTDQGGNRYLQYDGHPGYDYGYAGTDVYAAASGTIATDADFAGSNLANTGLVAKYMKDYHGLIIKHPQGYCTIYMHLSWIDPRYVDTSDSTNWKPKKVAVDTTQPIGKTGSFGANREHLHFEVWRSDDGVWKYADPYGFKAFVDGVWKVPYPPLW